MGSTGETGDVIGVMSSTGDVTSTRRGASRVPYAISCWRYNLWWRNFLIHSSNCAVVLAWTQKLDTSQNLQKFIVYQMGRLCGGAHEISGIKAPIFLCGWVGGWWGGCGGVVGGVIRLSF